MAFVVSCLTSIVSQQTQTPPPNLEPSHHPVMPNINIDPNGVTKLLDNIKRHKAAVSVGVPYRVLNKLKDAIIPMLTYIFQRCLDSGELPADWREATIASEQKG